jgi:hypothetical protein
MKAIQLLGFLCALGGQLVAADFAILEPPPPVREIIREVPVEKVVVKEIPREVVKEVVKEVPREVIKEVKVEVPARPAYASYAEVHAAALRRGGYWPGQRVVIAQGVDEATKAAWAREATLNGWTFCVQDEPLEGLPMGVSRHQADDQGVLRPLVAFRRQASSAIRLQPPAFSIQPPAACSSGACGY